MYEPEVKIIESYLQSKIQDGDLADSKKAIDREIKTMEKMNNVKDEERPVVRIGILASYIKFLNDTKNIKRYANT